MYKGQRYKEKCKSEEGCLFNADRVDGGLRGCLENGSAFCMFHIGERWVVAGMIKVVK